MGIGWEDIPVVGKFVDPLLDPKPPPMLGDTDAAKDAAAYAEEQRKRQAGLATPTYGTSGIPTSEPTKPIPPVPPVPATATGGAGIGTGVNAIGQAAFGDNTGLGVTVGGSAASTNTNPLTSAGQLTGEQAAYRAAQAKYEADLIQYEKDKAAYDNYQRSLGGPASQVAAPLSVDATTIADPNLTFKAGVEAQQIGAPGTVNAQQIGAPIPVSTAGVQAPNGVTAGTVTADRIGELQMENVPGDIDVNSFGRDAQLRALGMAEAAALGQTPSAAEALLRRGIDENIGAAMGIAATTQGRNPGLAMRAGQTAAMNAIAKSSSDMAALRAEEIAKGRALFLEASTGIRAQDISVAQSNQTKNLMVSTENLRSKIEVAKSNQDAALRAGMSNQAAQLNADIANMQAELSAAQTTAELSLRSDIANMTASLDASKANQAADLNAQIANMTNQIEVAKANQKAALDAGIANQAADLEAQIRQMQAKLDADKANQAALLDAAKANAANNIQTNYQNATLTQQQDQFRAGQEGNVLTANQRAELEQQAINNQLYLGMTSAATNALGIPLGVASGDVTRQGDYEAGRRQFGFDVAKAIGTGGASLVMPSTTTQVPPPTKYDPDALMKPGGGF